MAGEPILVVDDNPANLKLLAFLLRSNGYEVRTAVDGVEALSILATFRPRLVLMDVQMPGLNGLEVTRRIKGSPDTADTLVVAVTAYAMRGDEERTRSAGCDGYISKPIDTRTLPGVVANFLRSAG